MGTRNLTCVMKDGEYKVAQYGQWDGYPEGQGATVLKFLQTENMAKFKERLAQVSLSTDKEIEDAWVECGAERGVEFVGMEVVINVKQKYPQFSRDTGGGILRLVMDTKGELKLENSLSFANESLFCEWCYVVDLDKNTFEVYKGFNKEALPENERFYSPEPVDGEYYPVRLRGTFDLDNLPTEEEFLMMFEEDDDEV